MEPRMSQGAAYSGSLHAICNGFQDESRCGILRQLACSEAESVPVAASGWHSVSAVGASAHVTAAAGSLALLMMQ